jgi:acyl-CoA synthetase (AMP-forming)/AMP-acid ligase II
VENAAETLVGSLNGSRVVVEDGNQSTTAEALQARTLGLSRWYLDQGVQPGDRVLILVPPGADFAAALLGLVWIGAVPVLLDPGHPEGVWRAQLEAVQPRWVVTIPTLGRLWAIPGARRLLSSLGRSTPARPEGARVLQLPGSVRGDAEPAVCTDDAEALILFTSGTTSAPRGVVHTHGNLPHFLRQVSQVVEGVAMASYLAEHPQQIFYALTTGATCHVVKAPPARRLQAVVDRLQSGQIEAWFGSPYTWIHCLDTGIAIPPEIQTLIFGSSPVTHQFLNRLLPHLSESVEVRCLYGLSEAGPVALADGREKASRQGRGDWLGPCIGEARVTLESEEIQVHSPALARGYIGEAPRIGPLATGDLGRQDADGLWLLGRKKDMILRRGVNHYPSLLESLLAEHGINASLVGIFDATAQDERIIVAHTGPADTPFADLLGEAAPDHVLHLESLPHSGRQHKVDKQALRLLARERFEVPS